MIVMNPWFDPWSALIGDLIELANYVHEWLAEHWLLVLLVLMSLYGGFCTCLCVLIALTVA